MQHNPARPAIFWIPAPIRERNFRLLWAGMGLSYAGDRLQELAQGWLVALLTGSALAVGTISIIAAIPTLLTPIGGVLADQVDRRRLMIAGQAVGVATSTTIGLLVAFKLAAPWHIYAWAFVSGLVWMAMRPAYKVALTQAVPAVQVRQAVGINSITETAAIVLMNGMGGLLVGWAGLPAAFAINSITYLVAITCLSGLRGLPAGKNQGLAPRRVLADLGEGISCLTRNRALWLPLLQTFLFILCVSPLTSLLPAIVHGLGGSVVTLGVLGAGASLGSLAGAVLAGMRAEGVATRTYALFGLIASGLIVLFLAAPLAVTGLLALAGIGFLAFGQAVWNTSRVPRLVGPAFQARLQSLTSMAFTLGGSLGAAWGGFLVDRYGLKALFIGSLVIAIVSVTTLLVKGKSPKQQ